MAVALALPAAAAPSLESALSPGPLIRGHAQWQDECARCHVRFNRAGQDALCLDCHKPVAQDVRQRSGFHGRLKPQSCRSCHTDHKGREVNIAPVDAKTFDHRQTDWPLRDAHAAVACAQCHPAGKAWRDAAHACAACHRADDVHQGSLGAQCADCHTERNWKEARFDHATTRFPLKGAHAEVGCADCHPKNRYRDVPTDCVGCHRADDKHRGRFGPACDSCHVDTAWNRVRFDHDTATRYPLRGKHRGVACDACHTTPVQRNAMSTDCVACHRKQDKHQGTLGTSCGACHVESGWKEVGRFDHDRSRFPLLGAHVAADCKACHRPGPTGAPVYRDTPMQCQACHAKDDRHEGSLGEACGACHGERTWKIGRFDHDVARFKLRGAHTSPPLACSACHQDARRYRSAPSDCVACHRKDDRHVGQLGTACASCHTDERWTVARFDHSRARFALLGAHLKVDCKACHASARFRDAPRDCLACHRKQDKHQGRLGTACESCHNARHWNLVQFDHDRQTQYPLTGAHKPVRCEACHRAPAPQGRSVAALGSGCVDCHRAADPHDGQFGARCDLCHQTQDWKTLLPRRLAPRGAPPASASAASKGRP